MFRNPQPLQEAMLGVHKSEIVAAPDRHEQKRGTRLMPSQRNASKVEEDSEASFICATQRALPDMVVQA